MRGVSAATAQCIGRTIELQNYEPERRTKNEEPLGSSSSSLILKRYCTVTETVPIDVRLAESRTVTVTVYVPGVVKRCDVVAEAPTTSGVLSPNLKRYSTIGDGPAVLLLASKKKVVAVVPPLGDEVRRACGPVPGAPTCTDFEVVAC